MYAESKSKSRRIGLILLAMNLIGAIAYLVRSSNGWMLPEEKGAVPPTAEPFVWFMSIAPVVIVFLVMNVSWGTVILSRKRWHEGRYWLLTGLIWLIAVCIDFAHH